MTSGYPIRCINSREAMNSNNLSVNFYFLVVVFLYDIKHCVCYSFVFQFLHCTFQGALPCVNCTGTVVALQYCHADGRNENVDLSWYQNAKFYLGCSPYSSRSMKKQIRIVISYQSSSLLIHYPLQCLWAECICWI